MKKISKVFYMTTGIHIRLLIYKTRETAFIFTMNTAHFK